MPSDKTLLAHITLSLATHPENIAVEALGHILASSEASRRALQDLVRTAAADIGPIAEVRTQASDEEGIRPDLAGYDERGVKHVFIEAKFWAGLTENQPVKYLERLPKDKPSALLFVAPAQRRETLWAELQRRVKDARGIDLRPDTTETRIRSAAVDGGSRRLMLTSWKHLLDRMASQSSAAADSRAEADIRQLLGLTQQEDADAFLPLRPEELGPEFPRRIRRLPRLVNDATTRACEAGWANVKGLIVTPLAVGYGRYIRISGAVVWFGVNFHRWAQHRDTPLWLTVYGKYKSTKRARCRLNPENSPGLIASGDDLYVPIDLPTGVEYEAVLDAVVSRLERIARLIDPDVAPSPETPIARKS